MSIKLGDAYWCNCWFPILYLLIKGKLRGIIWSYPFHWIGITKYGNYIHFSSTKKHDRCRPFWFQGQIKVSHGYKIKKLHLRLGKRPNGYTRNLANK